MFTTPNYTPFEATLKIHKWGDDKVFLNSEIDKWHTFKEIVAGYPKMIKYKQMLAKSFKDWEEKEILEKVFKIENDVIIPGKKLTTNSEMEKALIELLLHNQEQ